MTGEQVVWNTERNEGFAAATACTGGPDLKAH
jgi:hypothetical protein